MPHTSSQTFLRELDKKLWTAADKKGAQVSHLFLQDGKTTRDAKDTGKMPVLCYKITSTGNLIDDALKAVEKANTRNGNLPPAMSAALPFRIASSSSQRRAIRKSPLPNLAGLIDLIATIPFQHADLHAKDILGEQPADTFTRDQHPPLHALIA